MHHTCTAQGGTAALGPLDKTRINLTIRVEEAQGLTFAREKLLEEHRSSKTCQFLNSLASLLGSCHQFTLQEHRVLCIPGLHRLDHRRQPNLTQCRLHLALRLHFHPPWTPTPNCLAIPSVCSLLTAIPRAGSLASAIRTRCSSCARCRRMNAIVPSEEVISTRAPVQSSTCSRYVR